MKCWQCGNDTTSEFCTNPIHAHLKIHPVPVQFKQRFVVEQYLGGGGFGAVYKCFDPVLKTTVAIKKLHPFFGGGASAVEEARNLASLNHPNIVQVIDADPSQGLLVMEFLSGGSLEDRMQNDPEWVKENFDQIMMGVCGGLRAAHRQHMIHRDIKPGNILLTDDGVAKIADFGIARELLDSNHYANTIAGTLPYMAPEVLAGEDYAYEADIHSLGCVMYEIWAGQLAYHLPGGTLGMIAQKRTDPRPLREVANVDDALSDLVARMVTSDKRRIMRVDLVAQHLSARTPRKSEGGVRTIDELQARLGLIYGEANSSKTPEYLLGQYLVVLRSLVNELPGEQGGDHKAEQLFPRAFAWLAALATAVNARMSELLWLKYDDVCPYCEKSVCECGTAAGEDEEQRNRVLLKKMMERRLDQAAPAVPLEQYQAKFRRMFGPANESSGVDSVKLHAFSEVAEAMDALLHLQDTTDPEQITVLLLEISDLLAWFFALLNSYSPDYPFSDSFEEFFGSGCYACGGERCKCEGGRGMLTWREQLA